MEPDPDLRTPVPFAKAVVAGVRERNVPFMAASIAYQAFVSLIPLLVLVFFLVSVVGDEQLAATVAETTEGFLPESGTELLEDAIAGSVATAGTSVIGLVVLLWGSLKIFRGLDTAFSEVYDSTAERSFVGQLRDALVVFGALGLALLAAAVASGAFAFFPDSVLLAVVNPLLLVVGLTVAFFPMYYVFPNVDVSVREVLPGVVVAAVGWAALQALFQVYVAFASGSESAGAIGGVLLVLTWLYFGALVLLVGAVVNATGTGRLVVEADAEETPEIGPDSAEVERERLAERVTDLERERDLLAHDLHAARELRDRLERRSRRLEAERDRLERETERLRAERELRREPGWQRLARRLAGRVSVLSIGVSRSDE
ncbi:YihY/virulence factor BrkB family protein [Salinilacihabitans rarus]|uniref:YihY/virulence factor BrkB family protein n=1 Tax=Salinilacihabitans rarus TaxID=2961596 RepID=UPI0020C85B95|nr:YihY/virulence factor BrkB family protein [Salinilacihabitans rarus]